MVECSVEARDAGVRIPFLPQDKEKEMLEGLGEAIEVMITLLKLAAVLLLIFIPLGIWKLVDLICLLF